MDHVPGRRARRAIPHLFRPSEFEDLLRRSGFVQVEQAGAEELRKAYLADRPDAQLTGIERLATAYV